MEGVCVYRLDDDDYLFPDPLGIPEEQRDEEGLFAVGGDLSAGRLVEAYSMGVFPWTDFRSRGLLHWYCPMQRFVIFPAEVHVSHSMRTLMNRGEYRVTMDEDFEGVIGNCSRLRIEGEGAWLGPRMVRAYTRMHELGYAHSVEVWKGEELVGGLYGVRMLRGFMGESMFSLAPSASKLALIWLCRWSEENDVSFIDCQMETAHLRSMGGRYISYEEYMDLLYGEKRG